jgi:hypothetical protein
MSLLVDIRFPISSIVERSRDSAVSTATGYGLDDRRVGVRVPVGSGIFSSPRRPNRLWGPPNLLSNGYRVPCFGSKARLRKHTYRVIQEELSPLTELISDDILNKKMSYEPGSYTQYLQCYVRI